MHLWRSSALAFLSLILLVAACAPQAVPTPMPTFPPAATATEAPTPTQPFIPQSISNDPRDRVSLRIAHAAAGIDRIDLFAEALAIATRLPYGTAVAGSQLEAGDYVFSVFASGDPSAALLSAPLSLRGGTRYTLLLSVRNGALRLDAIPEDTTFIERGQSRLQVIHAAATVANINVSLNDQAPIVTSLAFTESSPAITLPAGRVSVRAAADGRNVSDLSLTMRDGYGYVLLLQGEPADWAAFEELLPGQAVARAVNALDPSVGPVDVYLNDTLMGSSLAFGAGSDALDIAAQTNTLRVFRAGASQDSTPLIQQATSANGGDSIAYVLIGNEQTAQIVPVIDSREQLPEGTSAAVFYNADPRSPQLFDGGEGVVQPAVELDYAGQQRSLEFPAGEHRFYWRGQTIATPSRDFETFDPQTFAAGHSYIYILTGREEAPALVFERVLNTPEPSTVVTEVGTVRWVNAIADASARFRLDSADQTRDLPYATTDTSSVNAGSYTLNVVTSTGVSADVTLSVEAFTYTSVYAYGSPDDPQVMVIDDEAPSAASESARLRLMYIATQPEDRTLSLALSPSAQSEVNDRFEATPSVGGVSVVPFGAETYLRRTASGAPSLVVSLPEDSYDVYIIDDQQNGVIQTLPALPLQAGRMYEFVAVQSVFNEDIAVFVHEVDSGT